jgi:hypothetical protein
MYVSVVSFTNTSLLCVEVEFPCNVSLVLSLSCSFGIGCSDCGVHGSSEAGEVVSLVLGVATIVYMAWDVGRVSCRIDHV